MGHVVGQERSSGPHRNGDAVRVTTPLPWVDKAMFLEGKRVRHSFSQAYPDRRSESAENLSAERGNERKPRVKGRASDDNELVKHMSNLPGFLLQVEKESTVQEKALSFGVLDWRRLEKWKYTERMPGKLPKKATPGGDSFVSVSGLPKLSPNLRKSPPPRTRYPTLPGKLPTVDGSHFSSPQLQRPPRSLFVRSSKEERNGNYQKEEEYVESLKSKGKETWNQKLHNAEGNRISRQQNSFEETRKYYDQICSETNAYKSKRSPQKETMSERGPSLSSSKLGKQKIALISPSKVSAHEKKSEMGFAEVKRKSESSPAEPQNIVLLMPKDFQEKRCSESSQLVESRTSLDAQSLAGTGNRFSDFCSQEAFSGEQYEDIPHSYPLPSIDADICPNADSVTSTSSEAKSSYMAEETIRPSIFIEASNRKQAGVGENPTVKGRSSSPTRRFLGRISRSFSFKESSAVPQLSSTYTSVKSGPVKPHVAPTVDDFDRDQANASSRARASPLRRLLDPLLKHKTGSDTVHPLNGSLVSMTGPHQDKKPEASTFQALLQLTFKNGLPFFRLVVENRKDMLAAAVKRLPTSEKIDPCMIYSFYSVHEIKKKSMNWMSHGSRSKSCSLGYSIIGQMKISSIYHLKVNRGFSVECDARECVLYGVDPAQVDKQMLAFVPNKEIAAIVVKSSGRRVRGKDDSDGTVVILPGAVHGIPIKGAPSSLISRWRSNGLCDCGGWDEGCKLRILASSRRNSSNTHESTSTSVDHISLFMQVLVTIHDITPSTFGLVKLTILNFVLQGGDQKGKPVFSLKPLNDEFYSIELDPSVSLLEAFATSVAYLTSRKFPEIIELSKSQLEAEHVQEANAGTEKKRTTSFQEQTPPRFVTCPPLSPVGRI